MSTKERPIIFSCPMVRAILEGKKTQTRRRVVGQRDMEFDPADPHFGPYWLPYATEAEGEDAKVRCPYGKPGDRLWVRETWAVQHEYDAFAPSEIGSSARWHYAATENLGGLLKRPSIFLPRRGSRITLEITDVRVERLQQISDADALAEGCSTVDMRSGDSLASVYARLWQSIHGPDSWNANPWVWVMEFRRVGVGP